MVPPIQARHTFAAIAIESGEELVGVGSEHVGTQNSSGDIQ